MTAVTETLPGPGWWAWRGRWWTHRPAGEVCPFANDGAGITALLSPECLVVCEPTGIVSGAPGSLPRPVAGCQNRRRPGASLPRSSRTQPEQEPEREEVQALSGGASNSRRNRLAGLEFRASTQRHIDWLRRLPPWTGSTARLCKAAGELRCTAASLVGELTALVADLPELGRGARDCVPWRGWRPGPGTADSSVDTGPCAEDAAECAGPCTWRPCRRSEAKGTWAGSIRDCVKGARPAR